MPTPYVVNTKQGAVEAVPRSVGGVGLEVFSTHAVGHPEAQLGATNASGALTSFEVGTFEETLTFTLTQRSAVLIEATCNFPYSVFYNKPVELSTDPDDFPQRTNTDASTSTNFPNGIPTRFRDPSAIVSGENPTFEIVEIDGAKYDGNYAAYSQAPPYQFIPITRSVVLDAGEHTFTARFTGLADYVDGRTTRYRVNGSANTRAWNGGPEYQGLGDASLRYLGNYDTYYIYWFPTHPEAIDGWVIVENDNDRWDVDFFNAEYEGTPVQFVVTDTDTGLEYAFYRPPGAPNEEWYINGVAIDAMPTPPDDPAGATIQQRVPFSELFSNHTPWYEHANNDFSDTAFWGWRYAGWDSDLKLQYRNPNAGTTYLDVGPTTAIEFFYNGTQATSRGGSLENVTIEITAYVGAIID